MKTLVILCMLAAVGVGVVHGGEALCHSDVGDTINEGCVNCTCVLESPSNPVTKVWSCVQTCNVCPAAVVSRICLFNRCDSGVYCPLDRLNTTCVIPLCETCDPAFLRDGNLVNCTDKPGMCPEPVGTGNCTQQCSEDLNCPNNQKCCSNGCGTACYEPVHDRKEGMCPMPGPDVGGICVNTCHGDRDCPGTQKCCSNGCGHTCQEPAASMKPGMCPMPGPDVGGVCVEMCSGDGECPGAEKCCSNGCGHSCQAPAPRMCPAPGPDVGGICAEMCSGDSDCEGMQMCCSNGCGHSCQEPVPEMHPCPPDQPFMNCTYDDVCSSPCDALPSARCLVDHCGGCRPVHITSIGSRINCTTGQVVQCPPGHEMVNCLLNPCDSAECPADPMARCLSVYCGGCKAVFVNAQGEHINCTSGAASVCPPGLVENPVDRAQACAMATCPARPKAQCTAKQCVWPNSPLECPYEFFDARARPVQCSIVKRGQCPMVDSSGDVGGICVNECMDDTHCDGDEKCCGNECGGRVCRDPENDGSEMDMEEPIWKPGTCPMPPMGSVGGICVEECNAEYGDAGCPRHWKCCSNGCGHACRPPREMSGQCPMVPEGADMSDCQDLEECTLDNECQMNRPGSKCCTTACGTRCMSPVRSRKPGTCPMVPMDVAGICSEDCTSDDDCEARAKCCSNGCGHVCMDPEEQPGDCPARPDLMMLYAAPQVACSSDSDCSQRRSKCCAYGCGQICIEPVTDVKEGMCPMPGPVVGGVCVEMCSEDGECPGTRKCCSNGCGHSCQEAVPRMKPGMCPMPGPDVGGICAEMCSGDGACPGAEKCCSNGCGHSCQAPAPGMCPMPGPDVGGICAEMCSGDGDCEGMQMCCSNGCGHSCQEPVPVPQHMCPMAGPDIGGICVETCSGDGDCPGMQMCCSNGCGHSCQVPVPYVKPGMCPMPGPDVGGICAEMCSGDGACPGAEKCCSNGCGHSCQAPAPGMCPVPAPDVGGICAETCSGDRDCPGMQMCCSNGCGHSCQEPVPLEKVGVCPMVPPGLESNCMQKSCTGDHNCPGRKRCCEAGCEEHMCLVPRPEVMCEEELPEICEFDPCEFATCPSVPDATCAPDKCGRCRPRFFNQDLEAVSCAGKTFCKALGGADGWYESGAIVDSSDGCNQCVCNGLGTWTCSKRNCGKWLLFTRH
ncbi:balbiani ring protein 3-like isoform X2 [Patiria miniata]|uniref:WAP domain-containing protein n=1 Tax=Patiria miniata TaxID=46514 RepID=A0A914BGR3_PATMI|nr:balbiani ring protein 3-like isoform X2 [Patiria miniata]